MKISQMTNNQAADAMVRMAEPISILLEDKNLLPILNTLKDGENMSIAELVGGILPKAVSFAMKDHRNEVYEIVGALALRSTEEVGNMKFMETLNILKESVDDDFLSFFKQSGTAISKPGEH